MIELEKMYNPAEPATITLPMEQWQTVLHWLQCGADYHNAKMHEWLAVCHDKEMGAKIAAEHERAGAMAQALRKSIEEMLWPSPKPETE
jgi:hypothetical protein